MATRRASEDRAPWLVRARGWLTRWSRRAGSPGLVVAVSGGGDSVGLLRLVQGIAPELGLRVSVAHLDHGVRGEAAAEDARFVARLAEGLGLPIDLGRWEPSRPGHFEADARRARYGWLAEVARARAASAVAVGHTRDDQAETILHRILRGTGPRGLAGIPRHRPLASGIELLRPLLDASRQEVRDYLATLGQDFRDDATNADLSRTRARLRHDLLPRLATDYNPRVAEALVRLGRLAEASHRALARHVEDLARTATISAEAEVLRLDRRFLGGLPGLLRLEVLRLVWRRQGWPEGPMDEPGWRRLARLAKSGQGRVSLAGGIVATVEIEQLSLSRETVGPPPIEEEPVRLEVPGSALWGGGRVVATLGPDDPCDERIDLDPVAPPLWVGPARSSERFEPLGLEGRGLPLGDFLRGRRVPRDQRGRVPVLRDSAGILWVVGHRIAHRVRRTETTRRILGLRWEPGC